MIVHISISWHLVAGMMFMSARSFSAKNHFMDKMCILTGVTCDWIEFIVCNSYVFNSTVVFLIVRGLMCRLFVAQQMQQEHKFLWLRSAVSNLLRIAEESIRHSADSIWWVTGLLIILSGAPLQMCFLKYLYLHFLQYVQCVEGEIWKCLDWFLPRVHVGDNHC